MHQLTTYVALLRGINVGGKNIISMAKLKTQFEALGYHQVRTYINSGNVIFQATSDARHLETAIESALDRTLELPVRVVVRSLAEMEQLLHDLPPDWDTRPDRKYDIIFLRHTIDSPDILRHFTLKPDIEDLIYLPGTLLWWGDRQAFSRAGFVRVMGTPVYADMTIRGTNTVRKLTALMQAAGEAASS